MSLRPALLLLALTGFAADAPKTVTPAPKPATRPQPPTRPFDGPTAPKFIRLDGKPGATPAPTRGNATKPGAAPTNGKPGAAPAPARPAPAAPKPFIQ